MMLGAVPESVELLNHFESSEGGYVLRERRLQGYLKLDLGIDGKGKVESVRLRMAQSALRHQVLGPELLGLLEALLEQLYESIPQEFLEVGWLTNPSPLSVHHDPLQVSREVVNGDTQLTLVAPGKVPFWKRFRKY